MKFTKPFLAVILAMTMITVGCTDAWIQVALKDLPVLTQMALNIAALVSTVGGTTDQLDLDTVTAISNEAHAQLVLLDTLYTEYKANPSAGVMAKIENVLNDLDKNLPALLASARIKDPVLQTRVTVAVGLILTTVETFAALIPEPQTANMKAVKRRVQTHAKLMGPKELKKKWNAEVYPQFKEPGFWSGLGTGLGEWKFGDR